MDDGSNGMNGNYEEFAEDKETAIPRLGPTEAEAEDRPGLAEALGALFRTRTTPPRDPRTPLSGPALRMHQAVQYIAAMVGILGTVETRQAQADAHLRAELADLRQWRHDVTEGLPVMIRDAISAELFAGPPRAEADDTAGTSPVREITDVPPAPKRARKRPAPKPSGPDNEAA